MDLDTAREVLVQHSKSKLNGKFPDMHTHEGKLTNPICGDHVEIRLSVQNRIIESIGFSAKACAICSAASSLMCEVVRNKDLREAFQISLDFEDGVLDDASKAWPPHLQNLKSFEHLRINPTRRACALLPWVALRSILKEKIA